MRRLRLGAVSCLVGAGLVVAGVSPVWADESGGASGESAVVGGFGLGDGLEGSIEAQDGAFRVAVPAAGLNVGWDSRAMGADANGLGFGWNFGFARMQVDGGLWVFPSGREALPVDESSVSGLAGYVQGDVRFEITPGGVLPGRGGTSGAQVAYEYVLHELGGTSTYFNAAGDPVVQVDATGSRFDLGWGEGHRLTETIDADGVVTTLSWSEREVEVRPGSNLPGGGAVWKLLLEDGRVVGSVDPEGGRVQVVSDPATGLVTRVVGASGASTEVRWHPHVDGVARVERVTTFDADGAELSARTWAPTAESAMSSGWPVVDPALRVPGVPGTPFSSVLGDGHTEVESTYNSLGSLVRRATSVSTPSGERVVKEHSFQYPGTDEHGTPVVKVADRPREWANPSVSTLTHSDGSGGERSAVQRTRFDELGRLVEQTGVDGVVTTFGYDPVEAGAVKPPVGLQTWKRSVAPDGLVSEVRYELNDAKNAVVAETTFSGREGAELVQTGRIEFTVEADGFVSERREVSARGEAAGAPAEPRVTRWDRQVNLAAGEATLVETVGVGTASEVSRSSKVSLQHGGVLEQTGPTGTTSSASYDRLGRVVSSVDTAGRVTSTTYETYAEHGRNAVTVTGPDKVARTEVRDELGRVLQVLDNIDDGVAKTGFVRVAETREYPAPGQVRRIDAWGAVTSRRVDVFGREVEVVAANGLRNVTERDDLAKTTTSGLTPTGSLADALTTSTVVRDAADRIVSTSGTRADGVEVPEVGTVHDGFGRKVATTGGPVETEVAYDAFGNVTEQTHTPNASAGAADAQGGDAESGPEAAVTMSVTHDFDAYNAPVQKTVSDGAASYSGAEHERNALGQTTASTDQAGVKTSSTYTPDGLVAQTLTSTGRSTSYTYDEATRQVTRSVVSAPGVSDIVTEYAYDRATGRVTAVFDPADREHTEITYTYDAFGNTTSVEYPDGERVAYDHDRHGRLESMTDIDENLTRYTHDAAGMMVGVEQTAPGGAVLGRVAYAYDEFARLVETTRGNGVVTSYEYDSAASPKREVTTSNGAVISDRSYVYDASGELVERVDRVTDEGVETATTTTYDYDSFDRLIASTVHDGDSAEAPVTTSTEYVNTVAGDVESETVTTDPGTPGEQRTVRAFTYTPSGALTAVTTTTTGAADASATPGAASQVATQEYDVDGNVVRDVQGTTFRYDAAGRVIEEVTAAGEVTSFGYWADGSRSQRATTGVDGEAVTAGFYWDGDTLINDTHTESGAEAAEQASTVSYLVGAVRHSRTVTTGPAGEPGPAEAAAQETDYLGTDRHGNVTELTDEQGAVGTRYTYSDYGVTTVTHPGAEPVAEPGVGDAGRNAFQYAAGYADPSGRQHLDVRDYDAGLMRFTSPDKAHQLTNYAFGGLNPIMKVDPSGRTEIEDWVTNGSLTFLGVVFAAFTVWTMGSPLAAVGWIARTAWAIGFSGVLSDGVSMGLQVSEMVDRGLKKFIRDGDREAVRLAGIATGVYGAVAGAASVALRKYADTRVSKKFLAYDTEEEPVLVPDQELPQGGAHKFEPLELDETTYAGLGPDQIRGLYGQRLPHFVKQIPDGVEVQKQALTRLSERLQAPIGNDLTAHADLLGLKDNLTSILGQIDEASPAATNLTNGMRAEYNAAAQRMVDWYDETMAASVKASQESTEHTQPTFLRTGEDSDEVGESITRDISTGSQNYTHM